MKLKKQIKEGMFLSAKEIRELKKMYRSGKYLKKDICEWFGITSYEFDRYVELFLM